MVASNIQIIKKNGKKEYVVIPYEEFLKVQEELDDYQNLRCLREAKEAEQDAPTVSLEELKKQLKVPKKKSMPKTIRS
jgi:PHD/YefM family antitoxin component YafN of YafNO toxin-antitoxin module